MKVRTKWLFSLSAALALLQAPAREPVPWTHRAYLDDPDEFRFAIVPDRSAYKLYLADTGLLVAQVDDEAQADIRVRRNLGTWKGGLFENVVAEALVKSGVDLAYFKKDNSTLEMDFFLRCGDDLVPLEVKSENARAKSLRTLIASEHYPDIRWGMKLINGNVGFENRILSLPHWCAFLLGRLVKDESFRDRISTAISDLSQENV